MASSTGSVAAKPAPLVPGTLIHAKHLNQHAIVMVVEQVLGETYRCLVLHHDGQPETNHTIKQFSLKDYRDRVVWQPSR